MWRSQWRSLLQNFSLKSWKYSLEYLNNNNNHKMASAELFERLETRATAAERLIEFLKKEVSELKKIHENNSRENDVLRLHKENEQLRKEVEVWKAKLIQLEASQNIPQIPLPGHSSVAATPKQTESVIESQENTTGSMKDKVKNKKVDEIKKQEKVKKPKGDSGEPAEEPPIDVRRLDFRIGRIVSVKKHPDADSLYVEEIDVGEANPRIVVSGLVKFVPIDEMKDRLVVLLCNLKPAKMRGVTSEAMVMCASTPEKVEILVPPEGSAPGDLVHVEGYPREPDSVLNPKKKIFETVAPDLKTNDKKCATFKGAPWTVPGKGFISAPSLVGVNVK